MAHAMARGGSGKIMDYPTRQTGWVFLTTCCCYDQAIQLEKVMLRIIQTKELWSFVELYVILIRLSK